MELLTVMVMDVSYIDACSCTITFTLGSNRMLLLLSHLLGEVEGLVLFALLSSIYKAVHLLFGRVCSSSIAVLLYELFNQEVATADTDNDLIFLNLHENSFLAVFIDTLTFSLKAHLISDFEWHAIDEHA